MANLEKGMLDTYVVSITFDDSEESETIVPNLYYGISTILGYKLLSGVDNNPVISFIQNASITSGIITDASINMTSSSQTDRSTYQVCWCNRKNSKFQSI